MSCEYRVVKRSRLDNNGDIIQWLEIMYIVPTDIVAMWLPADLMGKTKQDIEDLLAQYRVANSKPVLEERDGKFVEVEE